MKIKVFNRSQPVLEVKWDEQQKANFGLHRNRRPDRDHGQLSWGRMDEKSTNLSEVELTPELKKILIEDICEVYHGEMAYLKLMSFQLINESIPELGMSKEIAIQRFKDACANPRNADMRKNAVERQYVRNTWDIIDHVSFWRPLLLRIENNNNPISIHAFTPGHNYTFNLSVDEFKELEKLYFGEFQSDYEYLSQLGVIFEGK